VLLEERLSSAGKYLNVRGKLRDQVFEGSGGDQAKVRPGSFYTTAKPLDDARIIHRLAI
jgi:hypothetical protein